MAHQDYARKRSAATPRNQAKSAPARSSAPGWLWLVVGLVCGFFIAFLFHLWKIRDIEANRPLPHPVAVAPAPAKPGAQKPEPPAAEVQDAEPHFDFYTLLPNQRALPDQQAAEEAAQPPKVAPPEPAPTKPAQAEPTAPKEAKVTQKEALYLQTGSFKSIEEADRRRAEILLLGLPVKVQTVKVKDDQTWYRVVVGPFQENGALGKARQTLANNRIQSIPLKKG